MTKRQEDNVGALWATDSLLEDEALDSNQINSSSRIPSGTIKNKKNRLELYIELYSQ